MLRIGLNWLTILGHGTFGVT